MSCLRHDERVEWGEAETVLLDVHGCNMELNVSFRTRKMTKGQLSARSSCPLKRTPFFEKTCTTSLARYERKYRLFKSEIGQS